MSPSSVLPADYHMHTPLCRHASGTAAEYVAQARALGLPEIGFSDHNPQPRYYDDWRMLIEELPAYLSWIDEARAAAGASLPVRAGLEIDWLEGGGAWIGELSGKAEWDYLIGSVHYLGSWNFDNPAERHRFYEGGEAGVLAAWDRYWKLFADAARSGFFDIMGHPDLIKKFGHRPAGDLRRWYEPAIAAVQDSGVAIEINTAGAFKDVQEMYPASAFLELACKAGVPLTINSDAHAPCDVGRAFPAAVALARDAGYRQLVRFERRRRIEVPLE